MTAFKIYLPAAPRQDVNHGELPWVYDQDPASGNVASMWVTPVKNLPPERQWVGLMETEIRTLRWDIAGTLDVQYVYFAQAIEAKLKEKNT